MITSKHRHITLAQGAEGIKNLILPGYTIKAMGMAQDYLLAKCEYRHIRFRISLNKDGMLLIEFFAKGEDGYEKLDVLDNGTNTQTIAYNLKRSVLDNIREAYYEATGDIDDFIEYNTDMDDNAEFLRTPKYVRPCIP